ncbi:hypothetical protein ACHAXR_001514 [Thalassiosira sp. AJA248-18]
MDSAYMGDVMGQIGREVWEMNFVGTCQTDRTGADVKEVKKNMTVGSYHSELFQHLTLPLSYTMWGDNNIVKTLSNFHTPEVLPAGEGVLRKRRVDGVREQNKTEVSCPVQQKDYSETFHLIDKGNGKESKYDMGGQTKGHNWAPKLHMRFWNFGLGNSHTVYDALVNEYTPNRRKMKMPQCVKFLSHSLMQRGAPMRRYIPEMPKCSWDLGNIFDYGTGRKVRNDAKGTIAEGRRGPDITKPIDTLRRLRHKQKKSEWRTHQSISCEKKGRCQWENCPGKKKSQAMVKRTYDTYMRCEECSARLGKNMFLCNGTKSGKPVLCHIAFHTKYHNKKYINK